MLNVSDCAGRMQAQIELYMIPSELDSDQPASTSASHSVGLPVHGAEVSGLGRSHHQVLHVPPSQVHAACTQEAEQSKPHLPIMSEVITFYIMHIMRRVRLCWPKRYEEGNMRSDGKWKRSGVSASIYSENSLSPLKYHTESYRESWGVCQSTTTKVWAHIMVLTPVLQVHHILLCWKVREHSKTADTTPWRIVSRLLCNDSL